MVVAKTIATPVEQRAEESTVATTPPQPTLPLTSLQKLEAAYELRSIIAIEHSLMSVLPMTSYGRPTGGILSHSRPSATTSRWGASAPSLSIRWRKSWRACI